MPKLSAANVQRLSIFRWLAQPPGSTATILAAVLALLFLRKPDQLLHPQFWAEDGFFYQQPFLYGWHTLLDPYQGYLHTIPRLIAATAWWFDPGWAPGWFVAWAAIGSLYVASRALSPRQPLRPRPLLALAVVLVPDAFEVLLNVTNLQWILAAGLFLLLISDDAVSWKAHWHDLLASTLLGLTGPFSILAAPLFLTRALIRRTAASWLLFFTVGLTAAVQLYFVLHFHENVSPDARIAWIHGITAVGTRQGGSLFIGVWLSRTLAQLPRLLLTAGTIAIVGFAVARPAANRQAKLILGLCWALLLAASLYRCRWVLEPLNNAGFGSRYFYPLQLIMLWLVITFASDARPRMRHIGTALLALAVVTNFTRLREPALNDLHWADYAAKIRAGQAVLVHINPAGWTFFLPERSGKP
jgi:hypothetical protein